MKSPNGHDPHSAEKPLGSQPQVLCSICNCLVTLESAKSDEYGRPVHEECYVLKTQLKRAGTPPAA
ncbi:MAG TPA: hypothetical protein VJX47_01455 [Candidatus Sulfotelmatobacter sp.]|nr:hypothetical protein [Candidatus Sulfotelmatobacter sp.]